MMGKPIRLFQYRGKDETSGKFPFLTNSTSNLVGQNIKGGIRYLGMWKAKLFAPCHHPIFWIFSEEMIKEWR